VVEHGTFEELNARESYISRLNVSTTSRLPTMDVELATQATSILLESKEKPEELEEQAPSHVKPTGVYRYYIKAVGPFVALTYLLLAMVYAFLYSFPSKLRCTMYIYLALLTIYSHLGKVVVR
jgi:hypothetical protein